MHIDEVASHSDTFCWSRMIPKLYVQKEQLNAMFLIPLCHITTDSSRSVHASMPPTRPRTHRVLRSLSTAACEKHEMY